MPMGRWTPNIGRTEMRYVSLALVLTAALTLGVPTAHAIPMTFVANLTQANEVPPTGSPATGLATVILDPTAETIQINAAFSVLTSNDVMAHINAFHTTTFLSFVSLICAS